MGRACAICGKKTTFGRVVSHAHNVSSRRFKPNLQRVRVRQGAGSTRRISVCTRCLRAQTVQKAVS
jgi:large subunit ribosomal protein L28